MNWKRKEHYHAVIHEFHLLQHVVDKGTECALLISSLEQHAFSESFFVERKDFLNHKVFNIA